MRVSCALPQSGGGYGDLAWGTREICKGERERYRPVGAARVRLDWRANSRPGAHAARLYNVAPLGLGIWRAFGPDLGLTPPGCTMSPRWGLGYGGRLVPTWGSRRQAVRCRPVGAWDMAGVWSRPGAHATRLYDVAPLGLGIWRAFGPDRGVTPPGCTMSPLGAWDIRASTERSLQCGKSEPKNDADDADDAGQHLLCAWDSGGKNWPVMTERSGGPGIGPVPRGSQSGARSMPRPGGKTSSDTSAASKNASNSESLQCGGFGAEK